MAYTSVDSPLGPLVVAATPRGLVRVAYTDRSSPDDVLAELASARVAARARGAARLDDVRRELDEYFAGRRHEFETPVDWSHLGGFTRKVLRATARIPFGDTGTYAAASPRRRGARARSARPATRSARTRFRSLFHAIACSAPAERSGAIRAAASARSTCSASRAS